MAFFVFWGENAMVYEDKPLVYCPPNSTCSSSKQVNFYMFITFIMNLDFFKRKWERLRISWYWWCGLQESCHDNLFHKFVNPGGGFEPPSSPIHNYIPNMMNSSVKENKHEENISREQLGSKKKFHYYTFLFWPFL